jgi:hypothetical protein
MIQDSVILDSLGKSYHLNSSILTSFSRAFQSTKSDPIDLILSSPEAHPISEVERNTWLLIERCLNTEAPGPVHPQISCLSSIYASLNELNEVKLWLENTAPATLPLTPRPAYFSTTIKDIRGHGRRSTLVDQIDPDAAGSRQRGKTVSLDDQDYQGQLYQAIFGFLRVGNRDGATELAEASKQPWLAAVVAGSILQTDPELDGKVNVEREGNANRHVWKGICLALAESGTSDVYEKALFSHFAGDSAGVFKIREIIIGFDCLCYLGGSCVDLL